MEYLSYTLEQIMDTCINYQKICNLFLESTDDIELKAKLKCILYEGEYNNYCIRSNIVNKDNPAIEGHRRISMAYLLLRNPETFDVLAQNQINLFHGTNANALPNILKYGLNSVAESQKIGIDVSTGEKYSRINGTRKFVSFTDILDIAEDYSAINPTAGNDLLSFEVIIGTTIDDILQAGKCRISSDIPEVGVRSKLPLESIRVICVPSDKVEFVKKIVNTDKINVLAIDGIDEKFYYIDDIDRIHIFDDRLNKLRNNLQNKSSKVFSIEETENVMRERFLSNIRTQLRKIKSIMTGGRETHYDGRKIK